MVATLDEVLALADLMGDFPRPWWVAGGWAIDLWLGEVTREHADLEIGLLRDDQLALRDHFSGWLVDRVVGDGPLARWVELPTGERVDLPEFQLRFRLPADGRVFEVFLNDLDAGEWVSRRHPTVRLPLGELVCRSPRGLPLIVPEVQLLYKAKYHREKDEHDFQLARSRLTLRQRSWLRRRLLEYHPGDPWLAGL
jgi:hypothetical protein